MRAAVALLVVLLAPSAALAQNPNCVTDIRGNQVCGTRAGQCVLDRYRNAWCAPDGGSAFTDRYGDIVCGAGACVRDGRSGEIFCASRPVGPIATSPAGAATCEGGCVQASASACRRMTPN
jgi:hypothetical protein